MAISPAGFWVIADPSVKIVSRFWRCGLTAGICAVVDDPFPPPQPVTSTTSATTMAAVSRARATAAGRVGEVRGVDLGKRKTITTVPT